MVGIALVVPIVAFVRVVVQADGADLVADCDDWLVGYLDDVRDLVVGVVLLADLLEVWVSPQALAQPL